jgi:hypothetical protein
MATYHVSIKVARKVGTGDTRASAHYLYLSRLGQYETLRSDEELINVESGNMPTWAVEDPAVFWYASDIYERKRGSVYREIEAALPRELSSEQQYEIVQKFVDQVLSKDHPYTFAIHSKASLDNLAQPHVHLMWSERKLDGIERDPGHFFQRAAAARKGKDGKAKRIPHISEGGCKKISMHPRIDDFRELWATMTNDAYSKAGLKINVSHKSFKERGIDKDPERHLGPSRIRHIESKLLLARRKAHAEAEIAEAEGMRVIENAGLIRVRQNAIRELLTSAAAKSSVDRKIR